MIGFVGFKTFDLDRSWEWAVLPQERGTKLFKVRHISRPKYFYMGLAIFVSEPMF
jgi:hypothetical protein